MFPNRQTEERGKWALLFLEPAMARKGANLLVGTAWAGVFITGSSISCEGEADCSGGNNPFCFQENILIGLWVLQG